MMPVPPKTTLFPYTTLFRSTHLLIGRNITLWLRKAGDCLHINAKDARILANTSSSREDRKSTRLNSSHLGISYAVFCLKKKRIAENTHFDMGFHTQEHPATC